jgi:hypothetical protein
MFDPGLQNRVRVSIVQALERDDRLAGDVADTRLTRADRPSVYPDRAGAALGYPASKLGAGDTEFVAQCPKQRHLRNDVNLVLGPIDREFDHIDMSLALLTPVSIQVTSAEIFGELAR